MIEKFNSNVPSDIDKLISLPGVGRKTANVVMSNAYNIPAIAVDTHVFRVANRIGLTNAKNVESTENQLMLFTPNERWTLLHHQLIFHGRRVCKARKPLCGECIISSECKYYKNINR